jgi:hypothetical protein
MSWNVARWLWGLSFFTFAEIGPSTWVDNRWIQMGAVGALAVCLLLSILDNAKARKDWLKQLSEQSKMRRDDATAIQLVLNRIIEHCSGHSVIEHGQDKKAE